MAIEIEKLSEHWKRDARVPPHPEKYGPPYRKRWEELSRIYHAAAHHPIIDIPSARRKLQRPHAFARLAQNDRIAPEARGWLFQQAWAILEDMRGFMEQADLEAGAPSYSIFGDIAQFLGASFEAHPYLLTARRREILLEWLRRGDLGGPTPIFLEDKLPRWVRAETIWEEWGKDWTGWWLDELQWLAQVAVHQNPARLSELLGHPAASLEFWHWALTHHHRWSGEMRVEDVLAAHPPFRQSPRARQWIYELIDRPSPESLADLARAARGRELKRLLADLIERAPEKACEVLQELPGTGVEVELSAGQQARLLAAVDTTRVRELLRVFAHQT